MIFCWPNTGNMKKHFMFFFQQRSYQLKLLGMAVWLAMNTGSIGIWQLLFYAPAAFAGTLVVFYFLGLSKADRLELQQIATSIKFFRSDKGFSKN